MFASMRVCVCANKKQFIKLNVVESIRSAKLINIESGYYFDGIPFGNTKYRQLEKIEGIRHSKKGEYLRERKL